MKRPQAQTKEATCIRCGSVHTRHWRAKAGFCPPCAKLRKAEATAEHFARNPGYSTAKQRVYKGLSAASRGQPANCECCGNEESGKRELSLDHDHTTGKFRGWLCFRCNTGIGCLGDTISGVVLALRYLEKAERA